MVDNKGVSPITTYFKAGDASGMANKMSEEKYGQGGEYFASEMEETERPVEEFHDRSAQLRASLNGLAVQNVGSMEFMKKVKEKEKEEKNKKKKQGKFEDPEEEFEEQQFSD